MSAIAGLSDLTSLVSMALNKSDPSGASGSSGASGGQKAKGADGAKGAKGADGATPLLDKLKGMSPEEIKKAITALADTLMKMMPIDSSKKGASDGEIGPLPQQAAPQLPQQQAAGGGGGGGGTLPAGQVDGQGPGKPSNPQKDSSKPWDSFSQGGTGNCVSVAILKAGMDKYGDKLFNSKESDGKGGFNLELQNGKKVSVSSSDLAEAKQDCKFKGDPNSPGYMDALVGYAAIGKGKAEATGQNFSTALKSLGDGEQVPNVAHYLGLKVNSISAQQAGSSDSAIKIDIDHAMAMDDGQVDLWGRKAAFGTEGMNDGGTAFFDLA